MQSFNLHTLVDITETNEYRPSNGQLRYRQQQNFQTVINIIGLRANVITIKSPVVSLSSNYKFGNLYKTKQKVWTYVFSIEQEGAIEKDMLIHDFNHVPVIIELEETAEIRNKLFLTKGDYTNIIFDIIDK
jgi:hypothetical protein